MTRGWIQILLQASNRRSASKTPFKWRQMAFRWRADAAGPSLNARMITVFFQGIRTRIAEKPYIFVIFRWRGRLGPRMSYGGESFGVRPFFIVAPIVLGACLIMLFSVDERGHLGEKKSVADNIYMSGASPCVVSLSKTHLSLF